MTFLHEIVAVAPGVEADHKAQLAEVIKLLSVGGDRNPLTGLYRTHEPKADQDQQPAERRLVQLTTALLLTRYATTTARHYDVQLARDSGNAEAAERVEIDGQEILPAVPATYLLFLENQLSAMLTGLIAHLQAFDPAEEWHHDDSDAPGVYRSAPRETLSTTKRLVAHVAYNPAPDIPAPPVEWRDTDVVTGRWTWVKSSGQLPMARLYEIRERLSLLLAAVRAARQRANRIEVRDQHVGQDILRYVLGQDLVP
jgi:hypothetical protein